MRRILFLTDFSENSKNAMRYGQALFAGDPCEFFVLHVKKAETYTSDDLMAGKGNQSLYSVLMGETEQQLRQFVDDFQDHNPKHQYEAIVDCDVFIDAVKQAVNKHHIDIVIMGTNGASDLKETVLGSNALNVLRHVDCTTLVVPRTHKFITLDHLLLALDIEDHLDDHTLSSLLKVIKNHGTTLRVLRILPNVEKSEPKVMAEDKTWLKRHIKDLSYNYANIPEVPLSYVVDTYVHSQEVDMVAFVGQYQSFVKRLFGTGEKTKISKSLKRPLIIFHN